MVARSARLEMLVPEVIDPWVTSMEDPSEYMPLNPADADATRVESTSMHTNNPKYREYFIVTPFSAIFLQKRS